MKTGAVILLAMLTSIATTVGLQYAQAKYGLVLFQKPSEPPPAKAKRAAPNLVGLMEADAKSNLEALGLKMIIGGRTASPGAREGAVIEQSPKAGEAIAVDEVVTITVATALPKVPDIVGKTVADATRALTAAGYTVKVADPVNSEKLAAGLVVSQTPAAGEPLQPKEAVTLRPSAGVGDVKVPKLIGLGIPAAKAEAEKANLKVTIQWTNVEDIAPHIVLRQEPKAGESVKPQTEVKIFANQESQ